MGWVRTVMLEIWGLFVDDGSFALAIVAWVGLVWVVERWVGISGAVGAGLLFAGLGVVLVVSVLRFARSGRGA